MKTKALVILSGGQDSTTCLALAVKKYDEVYCITFDYGQRHVRELDAAKMVSRLCKIPTQNHEFLTVGNILNGTSPLTNRGEQLEQYKDYKEMDGIIGDRVEKTFVPMRNALFLTLAANRAACIGAQTIITGICQADNANYPDCREQFRYAQELAINEALGNRPDGGPWDDAKFIHLDAPLMWFTKEQSIQLAIQEGFYPLLAFTHTAYDGAYPPVGHDHATTLRAQGFLEAGVPDPLVIRAVLEGLMPLPEQPNYDGWELGGPRAPGTPDLYSQIADMKRALNT